MRDIFFIYVVSGKLKVTNFNVKIDCQNVDEMSHLKVNILIGINSLDMALAAWSFHSCRTEL